MKHRGGVVESMGSVMDSKAIKGEDSKFEKFEKNLEYTGMEP